MFGSGETVLVRREDGVRRGRFARRVEESRTAGYVASVTGRPVPAVGWLVPVSGSEVHVPWLAWLADPAGAVRRFEVLNHGRLVDGEVPGFMVGYVDQEHVHLLVSRWTGNRVVARMGAVDYGTGMAFDLAAGKQEYV